MNTEQPTDQAISTEAMRAALLASGWREILGRIWKSPRGKAIRQHCFCLRANEANRGKEHLMKNATHDIRRMEIEPHRDKDGAITGHTVHHYMMPSKSKKKNDSMAFYEDNKQAFPFGADQHDEMIDHIDSHLAGLGTGKAEKA